MKRYGYHRTSTREQHLDRGILEINKYCSDNNLELEKVYTDQQTGKNFNRPGLLPLFERSSSSVNGKLFSIKNSVKFNWYIFLQ